jgi:pyruvate-formate lyase-activating enzyme
VINDLEDLLFVMGTCGYGSKQDFLLLLARADLFFFDVKFIDREAHRHYTGKGLVIERAAVNGLN